MNRAAKAYYLLRYFGPRIVWLRGGVYLRKLSGATRRAFAPRDWESIPLSEILRPGSPSAAAYHTARLSAPPRFLFPLGRPPLPDPRWLHAATRVPPLGERLTALRAGRCAHFFRSIPPGPVCDAWERSALTGGAAEPLANWFEIPDFRPSQGDMRALWEPARCAWALDLARAAGFGLADDADPLLWRWLDSFLSAAPPFRSPHWKCGQESSVRFIALTLAVWALAKRHWPPQRWVQFARLGWATGCRVERHIDYAVSQKNNHAISEATGLLLIAAVLPELRDAARWEALGRRVLEQELQRQIYADGSYVQHSMNYHRVMLQTATLALRLCEVVGRPMPRPLYERVGRAAEFLIQMTEPQSGWLPNYGHNDGALVLPLSECDFNDYRPAINAAWFLVHRRHAFDDGPWREEAAWLFHDEAAARPLAAGSPPPQPRPAPTPRSAWFDAGGYATLRGRHGWAMIRCHSYRDRPSHCDPLHVDLWLRGVNVLQDAGTYLYYQPGRADRELYFKGIRSHNTVEVDGQQPMELASRFLWLPWLRSEKLAFEQRPDGVQWFEGQHFGYQRRAGVVHRRAVLHLPPEGWLIIDDLLGVGAHAATLRWHLADCVTSGDPAARQATVQLALPGAAVTLATSCLTHQDAQTELVRGVDEPDRVMGWTSRYYAHREASPVLECRCRGALPQRWASLIAPAGAACGILKAEQQAGAAALRVGVSAQSVWTVRLHAPGDPARRILLDVQP